MSALAPEPLPQDLRGVAQRVADATAGPWLVADDEFARPLVYRETPGGANVIAESFATEADAQFVCTARERMPQLLAEVTRLREELAAHQPRPAVLREAANGLVALGPLDSLVSAPAAWTEAIETIRRMADQIEADARAPEPLVVSRFDVAMEPAPEEEPVLTIGCIAEDGRPVALLLDPETRRKVHEWTRSGLPPLRAPRNVRVVSTEAGTWRVRWYIRQNRKAKSFSTEEQANAYAEGLREKAREMHAARERGEA
ncbi:hypothetical protein [Streptomyces sp. NPDC088925]|uniref:hypothetical protein n=1 Tax=Streptomyces sp. NPDC088925 TaxID=3365914 RepID=UPI00381519C1